VKELAKQTARATEEISRRISMIQGETRAAVEAIEQISQIVGQIHDLQNATASAVEEQAATTNEITQSIHGIAQAAQRTEEGVHNTQGAASELARMAAELQSVVGQFKNGDGREVAQRVRPSGHSPKDVSRPVQAHKQPGHEPAGVTLHAV
jgi:methyl-accepting chemotaxis protein